MSPSTPVRIFLSYGHDDYASLAVRIKRDLEAQGHEVWFDLERLKVGGDWERYIEEGFEFVSKDVGSGRFLLLMTPHSVRRPDPASADRQRYGYCLNELARAYGRNLPIIPVMVADVEPPLTICSLQYLDMRQCFPAEKHEEQYKKQFDQLLNAVIQKQVPFEGVQQRLLNYLNPISYGDDLSRHLARFTGRDWVMNELEAWLASSQPVLWITGEAGVGKSAIAAWLCDKRPEIAAYHFCRYGNSDRVDARKALFSLAYQLSTQLPVYRDRLNASKLDETVNESNVPALFDRLFVSLLNNVVPITDHPHILLIDALDEATRNDENQLAALIGSEFGADPRRLPSWLRVIVTSRPYERKINTELQATDPWKLDAGRDDNLQDIRTYLYRELQSFTGNGAPSSEVVEHIVKKSEGLFLYVTWVRQELQARRLSLSRLDDFPRGLGGIYLGFFKRYFPDLKEYETVCLPALQAICTVREPLQHHELASLLGRSESEMRTLTKRLGSLFPEINGYIRPFHQSLRDWLVDKDRSDDYWIDISAQEQRLANLAWSEYQSGVNTMGQYCIKYAPSHLAACQRQNELKRLLLDPAWIEAKLRITDVVSLLADYDLVLRPPERYKPETATALFIGVPSRKIAKVSDAEPNDSVPDDPETNALRLVHGALRLSSNVIAKDPDQFAPQMVGRLLAYEDMPAVERFIKKVAMSHSSPG